MGMLLNPGNIGFASSVCSSIYVDKTELIECTNHVLGTEQRFMCVSRPRRFGKSMAAKMLAAYYSRGCDSFELFKSLKIAQSPTFEKELNKHPLIYLDVQWFLGVSRDKGNVGQTVSFIQAEVIRELAQQYPDIVKMDDISLSEVLFRIHSRIGEQFVIIIDEWDCLFREEKDDTGLQENYINFLRGIFKGILAESSICLAYITGILPIKKYGTQSALNNFDEFTMINPVPLELYVGFTEEEAYQIYNKYNMNFEEARQWYDGYVFRNNLHIYNPKSVLDAARRGRFGSYWTQTETYESLRRYIEMDFDGLKEAVITMLGGGRCKINTNKFQNDMTSLKSKDDVLTLLVHLGYLAYDANEGEVFIPNQEVAGEFENAVEDGGWEEVMAAIRQSEELLNATLRGEAEVVAEGMDRVHMDNTSILAYHNELSLGCAITIAYYSAKKDYTLIRELPTGKGFADIVFLPHRHSEKPALIVELKWNSAPEGAIAQIKSNNYAGSLKNYEGNILLVGISYDKKSKKHQCIIEQFAK